ncbi:divalent-cation tolerance protein CutA [Synechococcus sp. WH 8109]|uniref:divalent-cation tolerance protein CutA n=1 Tax=Synechococcus sp. WH 8109 TaxID=166314 RepID=UPI00046CDD58|nr:divalent-cation tolerance protein CutA [Synechococcus sp. WH 8109]
MIEASGLVLALTTEANAERAQELAEALLELHLVACVSIHPVQSFYHWEGVLQASHEVQLLMKTSAQHVDALRSAVSELHSYDTPEWLCWPVTGSSAYAAWAIAELSSDASPPAA